MGILRDLRVTLKICNLRPVLFYLKTVIAFGKTYSAFFKSAPYKE